MLQKCLFLLLFGIVNCLYATDSVTVFKSLQKRKPVIAILPFTESYGHAVTSMLGTHLRNETNFTVLERSRLSQVINEQKFAQTGLSDAERNQLRNLFSVEVALTGEAFALGSYIQVDARLISISTGEVLAADYIQVTKADGLRDAISKMAKSIENKYLRQWMGNVQVTVFPVDGEVYLNEQFVGKASLKNPLRLNDLLEGQYSLRVLAGGYQKSEQVITVMPRALRELQIELKSLPGSLEISSEPLGATVFINEREMGKTPLKFDTIAEGRYVINMSMTNFKSWAQNINISSGQLSEVKAKLEVIPGALMIQSNPSGANVYLNRSLAGATPLLLDNLTPGTVSVELRLPDYAIWQSEALVSPGDKTQITPTLQRQTGKLTLVTAQSDVKATVYKKDSEEVVLNQELPFYRLNLDAGDYRVVLTKPRYYDQTYFTTILPDKETRLETEVRLKPGRLSFAKVGEAPIDVFIDGEYKGKANGIQVELPEGSHDILLRNWFGEKKFTVDVFADETRDISSAELAFDRSVPWWSALGALLVAIPILISGGR